MSQPIAGNQNFTKVENMAGQIGLLNTSEAKVGGNVLVGGSVQASQVSAGILVNAPTTKTIVKVELSTSGGTWWAIGVAAPLVVKGSSTNFTFSDTSTIVAAQVCPTEGFVGAGATLDLGVGASGVTLATDVLAATPITSLATSNDKVYVGNGGLPTTLLGSSGVAAGVSAPSANFLTVSVKVAALTNGQADVSVWYYV